MNNKGSYLGQVSFLAARCLGIHREDEGYGTRSGEACPSG